MKRLDNLLEAILLLVPVLLYVILKNYSLHPTVTDDWIYAYLADRMGEGAWPYRDFFFAHPPVPQPPAQDIGSSLGQAHAAGTLPLALGIFYGFVINQV